MWQANAEQRGRVQQLAQALMAEIPACGDVLLSPAWLDFFSDFNTYRTAPSLLLRALAARFDEAFLRQATADFLAFPAAHDLIKSPNGDAAQQRLAQIALAVTKRWLLDCRSEQNTEYAVTLISQRLQYLVQHIETDAEGLHSLNGERYSLDVQGCISLLDGFYFYYPEPVCAVYRQIMLGAWDGPVVLPSPVGATTRYAVFGNRLLPGRQQAIRILNQLCGSGELDYADFIALYRRFPCLIPYYLLRPYGLNQAETGIILHLHAAYTYSATLCAYVQRLACDKQVNADRRERAQLSALGGSAWTFHDGQWLLDACAHVETWDVATMTWGAFAYNDNPYSALQGIVSLAADEDEDAIIAQLRGFSEQTLLLVLPCIEGGQWLLLRALGWTDLAPMLAWLQHHGNRDGFRFAERYSGGQPLAPIAHDHAVQRASLVALLAQTDPEHLQKLLAIFRLTRCLPERLMYLDAVAGWNLNALHTSLKRGKHSAIMAYGLIGLQRGEAEVLERYLRLKQILKDSRKFGAGRQASTRVVVQEALRHLADTAGYADLARLEWDMEAKVSGDDAVLNQRLSLGDWEAELRLDGLEPHLHIFKQGKPLKTVPAGLRKLDGFLALKAAQSQIKEQAGRFRLALENLMLADEALTPDSLRRMVRLPVMRRLLECLIMQTEAGHFGWFAADGPALVGWDGTKTPLDGPVRIAHPYHFFQAGQLSAWQQAVVKRRVVQPFKQAFRELYILTPAEVSTALFSNRFAGHNLKSPVASRLLQTRGWRINGTDEWVTVRKTFAAAGLIAEFDFPDAYHHLTFMSEVSSDQIRFRSQRNQQPVALSAVPPLIFSEVMRDADLVVAVAQLGEDNRHVSSESYQRRAELISALLDDLGLRGVRCEGHFAYVSGKLAHYRVHLGSAAIHIEPGNYLCVVPQRGAGADTIFLPFADAEPKTSEVISKILLLVNDHKIKDQSILAQIAAANTGATAT